MKKISFPFLNYWLVLIVLSLVNCTLAYRHVKSSLDERYKKGIEDYKSGNFKSALDNFYYIQEIDPEFRSLKKYLLFSEKAGEKEVVSKYSRALSLQKKKNDIKALILLREVQSLEKNFKDSEQRIAELVKSEKVKSEITKLLKDAEKEVKSKKLLKARTLYYEVLKLDPGESRAMSGKKDVQKELNKSADLVFTEAEKKTQAKQYGKALPLYKTALEHNPEHEKAKTSLLNTERLIANSGHYEKGSDHLKKKKYLDAFISLSGIQGEYKDGVSLRNKAKVEAIAKIPSYIEEGKQYYNDNKLTEAVSVLNKVLQLDPNQGEAKKYKEQAEKKLETLKNFE